MHSKLKATAPWMLCSLALASCGEPKRIVTNLPPPSAWLVCEEAGPRPAIGAEHRIDWPKVVTVPQARAEHEQFVKVLRNRESTITTYLMSIEGKLFACGNNMQRLRQFYKDTAK